jgi:hypothetical protein
VHGTIETGLSVSQRSYAPAWIIPAVWVFLVTVVLGIAFSSVSWAFVDVYNNFYKATAYSWRDTITSAFASGVEYRPMLVIGNKLVHQLVGLRMWVYKLLVLVQFAAVLGCLVWLFRPLTRRRAVAACIALACATGLHSSRVLFMVAPLNAHSLGLLLSLAAGLLALSAPSHRVQWLLLPLTLFALLLLESGVLVVAVMLVLWKVRAPNATGRAVMSTLGGAAIYAAIRLGLGTQTAASTYTETGLGFADVSGPQLGVLFASAPYLLWIYNVIASLFTVTFSEPRAGRYLFIEALLHGHLPIWMSVHVITSLVTTAVVVYALTARRIADLRDRHVAAVGLTLVICGSMLGFLYTRDRIALYAGVGYAMLVYVAVGILLENTSANRVRALLVTTALAVVGAGWLLRTAEAYFQLRDAAWENHLEWTTRYEELGGYIRPQTDVLTLLRTEALEHVPADPRRDPSWTYALFERQFERISTP